MQATADRRVVNATMSAVPFASPRDIARAGERIYNDKYRTEYETTYSGRFAAIDVVSEQAYVADEPEEAVKIALEKNPNAIVHLIRIGAIGAFRVSYSSNAASDWIFGQERQSVD